MERREWRQLNPSGDWPPPAEKGLGWEHGGLIFLFGGYCQDGARLASSHQPYQVTQDPRTGGAWTNALVVYNPRWHHTNSSLGLTLNMFALSRRNCYQYPSTRGCPPSPRCGSAACVVGHRVFLFGGRCKQRRLNDLHCLDLATLAWSLLDPATDPDPFAPPSASRPAPRSLHTMANIGANRWADNYILHMSFYTSEACCSS